MATAEITMLDMSKKKQPSKKKPGRVGMPLSVWISSGLRTQLDKFIDQFKPRASLKAHVEEAVAEYLAKHGFWPPSPPPP